MQKFNHYFSHYSNRQNSSVRIGVCHFFSNFITFFGYLLIMSLQFTQSQSFIYLLSNTKSLARQWCLACMLKDEEVCDCRDRQTNTSRHTIKPWLSGPQASGNPKYPAKMWPLRNNIKRSKKIGNQQESGQFNPLFLLFQHLWIPYCCRIVEILLYLSP